MIINFAYLGLIFDLGVLFSFTPRLKCDLSPLQQLAANLQAIKSAVPIGHQSVT